MAKKKLLATQIKKDDVILLDRPQVIITSDPVDASKEFRAFPEGALIFSMKDKTTGHESKGLFLADDKIDVAKRPSRWENFKKWLDGNHKKYVESKPKAKPEIPLIFK